MNVVPETQFVDGSYNKLIESSIEGFGITIEAYGLHVIDVRRRRIVH